MPPKRNKEPQTDDEKFQQQLLLEQELARLQRQYVHLDRDRSQFSLTKLAKENKVYNIFINEHNNIQTDLAVANAPSKKKEDVKVSENLSHLLTTYDVYNDTVHQEKQYKAEIEGQIKMVQKEVQILRAQQITDRQYEDRVWNAMVTVEALENKLETQIRKFCTICEENRKLKEEIHHMLIERQNFMKIWETMIFKLCVGKKYMLDLIEQATIAYDQREEWCSKLQALRIKAHLDFQRHSQDMQGLKRRKDNNKKLDEFLDTKGQKRVMRDLQLKEQMKRLELKQQTQDRLDGHKAMMKEIVDFCNEEKVSVIAKRFCQQEEENFMLFNYVNDLNLEMEKYNDELGYLHLDIDEKREIHDARIEQQRRKLENMERLLEDLTKEATTKEDSLKLVQKELDLMMQGILMLFKICKCSNDPLIQLLGDNSTICSYNVLLYQEILEKKVHEVLVKCGFVDKNMAAHKKGALSRGMFEAVKSKPQLLPLENMAESNPCPLCVEHEMVSVVIEGLQFVLNRDEARGILEERLTLPDGLARVHNVSACHLPKSREIIQRRYQ